MSSRTTSSDETRWVISVPDDRRLTRVRESLLTVADGRVGTRASAEWTDRHDSEPMVLAAGVYERRDGREMLLEGPLWTDLGLGGFGCAGGRWDLDIRTATVRHRLDASGDVQTSRFASIARPGTAGLRLVGMSARPPAGPLLRPPTHARHVSSGQVMHVSWMTADSVDPGGGIAAAAVEEWDPEEHSLDRLVVFESDARRTPTPAAAIAAALDAAKVGFRQLAGEHQRAWAARWADADVAVDGADDTVQAAIRLALYHLTTSVADAPEAAVGARGLTGRNYDGHVFWDADVFTLPFLAATRPAASRAMLEYRVARLDEARAAARRRGRRGARFPWESAHDGRDVTPRFVRGAGGDIVPIRSGTHEDHIVADVAWACQEHVEWSADVDFARGTGRTILAETARYWASRVRTDRCGVAHIHGVEGPDEYHDVVDDNAYTNVMARWNLRTAAASERRWGNCSDEVDEWCRIASSLHDGFDAATGLYEQFTGFSRLEPLLIGNVARVPVAADLLLGARRVREAQVIKQPDVLMLHHLVPDAVAPGSLATNLDFYLPRTAHGSSLSPPICASLLARAGRAEDARALFELATRLDLDDLTGTTAGGVHLATFGGVWQALVRGFLGVRVVGGRLHVDPHLPRAWFAVSARVRIAGLNVVVRGGHDTIAVSSSGPIDLVVGNETSVRHSSGEIELARRDGTWRTT